MEYVVILSVAVVMLYFALRAYARHHAEQFAPAANQEPRRATCGLTDVCELPCTPTDTDEPAEYFDDEELDRFLGRSSDQYSESETFEFEDIMLTMRPEEVHLWLRSLQKRGIALPDALKQTAYMIVSESASTTS